jgi:hypothetical protein
MKVTGKGTVAQGRYDSSSCIGGDVSTTAAPDSDASMSANWFRIVERQVEVPTTNSPPPVRPEDQK